MASPYSKCGKCNGNMWPPSQMDHVHLTPEEATKQLSKYQRTRKHGWSKAANVRTNSPKAAVRTISPRKRAYGPF